MVPSARVRFVLCLLLAVATAVGGAVPARACACEPAARTASAPRAAGAPSHNCCKSAEKIGNCCAAKPRAKDACCAGRPSVERPALACTCERPAAPATPAPAVPSAPDADAWAAPSPVPTLALELPGSRPLAHSRPAGQLPPTDLVISLSRRTC